MIVNAKPLDAILFAPYGQVIMGSGISPERIPFAVKVENNRTDAKLNVTYMRINSVDLPVNIEVLERHPHSHQLFVPLNGTQHLVVVCPPTKEKEPNLSKIQAFTAEGLQAVNYYAGTWHAPRTPIGGSGEFIMMRWDSGTEMDEEFRELDVKINIV
jgi:ureidoglycolate lyase